MRLFGLTLLTMIAFAANSVLNRVALAGELIDPASFAVIRLFSGAAVLALIVLTRSGTKPALLTSRRAAGMAALLAYMLGFSFAYVSLDTGVGALVLFGGVQITMFAGALAMRERVPAAKWLGALIAAGGLAWFLWPAPGTGIDPVGASLMGVAALGWGIYSLLGRDARNATAETAANFALAAPVSLLALLAVTPHVTLQGGALAALSGILMSGLGYALWYAILPRLAASTAAIAQLSVPILAAIGGIVLLGEALTARFIIAAIIVLGGIGLSVVAPRMRA
ncbi:DMT family transporter [Hyphomonas sp.]|uniref:DMT family transporter n=1 Tax=Hyphomonas sp. TaxID=87 RepID=UPI0025C33C97|nr:DMT family transporter [Hyphomonas sp.]